MPLSIPELKATDVGRQVQYTSSGGDKVEVGRITSWNDKWIFVRYFMQIKPTRFARNGCTSEATDPKDLEFSL